MVIVDFFVSVSWLLLGRLLPKVEATPSWIALHRGPQFFSSTGVRQTGKNILFFPIALKVFERIIILELKISVDAYILRMHDLVALPSDSWGVEYAWRRVAENRYIGHGEYKESVPLSILLDGIGIRALLESHKSCMVSCFSVAEDILKMTS